MEPMAKDVNGEWVLTPSGGPAKYAIELNAGGAAAAGVKAGDRIEMPPEVQAPKNLE
jgi:uncharacterized membrane protein (UPF0127 family)